MRRFLLTLALALIVPSLSLADENILTTAAANGSFKTLVSLVVAADLDEALQSKGSFTVFAPSDEAFSKLPKETLESLLKPENKEKLQSILKYHVLPREISVPKRNSHPLKSAKTLEVSSVRFDRKGSDVKINDSNIVIRNIKCSSGLVHVIDAVRLPPVEDTTIVGVAQKTVDFKTLIAAAKAAGLAEALSGKGLLTVFAPTDKAFQKLPKGTLESLLKPENKNQLADIPKYHVIAGKVNSTDAIKAGSAKTLGSESVKISIKDGRLTINESSVLSNDVEASNGIIHVIDHVLLPPVKPKKTHTSQSTSSDDQPKNEITITSDWRTPVVRDGIKADKITIRVGGAGRVKLTNVQAKTIETSNGGGGSVSIEGDVENHTARVNGGAVLRARSLVSKTTSVNVNGGGSAEVNASKFLKASANAVAKIGFVKTDAKIEKSINKYATFSAIH